MTGVLGKGAGADQGLHGVGGGGRGLSVFWELFTQDIWPVFALYPPRPPLLNPPTRSVKLDQDDSNNWLKLWPELGWIQWSISVFVTGVRVLPHFQPDPLMSFGTWHHKSTGEVTSSKMFWNLFSSSAFISLRLFPQTPIKSPGCCVTHWHWFETGLKNFENEKPKMLHGGNLVWLCSMCFLGIYLTPIM